jgi:hypothetical protein
MAPNIGRIAKHTVNRVPSPLLRWTLRLAAKLLLPLVGAAATAGVQRLRGRLGPRVGPDGTVTVEINEELRRLAPASGSPAEPLTTLAERADLTLASVPGRPATCLRAVPKHVGDDIRPDVALAKLRLEAGELSPAESRTAHRGRLGRSRRQDSAER